MNLDGRLLHLARDVRLYLALTVGSGFLLGIAVVLQAHYLSLVVSLAFVNGQDLGQLQGPITVLVAVVVARAALVYAREAAAGLAAARIKASLRERLFAHLLTLGPSYVRGERTGELTNTAIEGIESLDGYFSQYLPNLALAALIPVTILAFVFPLDLLSGTIFLLTAPLIPLFMVLIGKGAEALTKRQWTRLSRMSAHFLDVLQGLTTLKLFGRSREQIRLIAGVSDRYREATMGVLRVAFLSALALELLATISTAVVAVEVGLRLLYAHLTFQQAFFLLILAPEFYAPLRTLGTSFHAGLSGVAAASRVFEILDRDAEKSGDLPLPRGEGRGEGSLVRCHAAPHPNPLPEGEGTPILSPVHPVSPLPRGLASPRLHIDDLHYSYDGGRRPALAGVSFEIGSGEKVALVGASGSGKSTIAHLLLRFLEPDRGKIVVDGVPLSQWAPEEWRKQVAWVPQLPYLFHSSVADNLRLAKSEATRKELEEATRSAHAHRFIESLPKGYDTVVGERAERLSGGQAQRIALARAFLKDARFLILDEATSQLDPDLECSLQQSMDRLMAGRTVLVIAHRLSTARRANRIVVLDEGRVAEIGNHEELVEKGGIYRQLVEASGVLQP